MIKAQLGGLAVLVATFLAVMSPVASANTVRYVDDSSVGGLNDGSDWGNAFVELQSALNVSTNGDEIRVAQGVYRPDFDVATGTHTGDREAAFAFTTGVAMYGGYAGNGSPDPDVRDFSDYVTILSGDLSGDDQPGFINTDDNSYRLIFIDGVGDYVTIDGFEITGGYSDDRNPRNGAGLFVNRTNMTLANCTIKGNVSGNDGGGIWANSYSNSMTVVNCLFSDNVARDGGAAYLEFDSVFFTNCAFMENRAIVQGGAFCNEYADPQFKNCSLVNNQANAGGGVCNLHSANPEFVNCIIWGNRDTFGAGEFTQVRDVGHNSGSTLRFCCIQGICNFAGDGNFGDDPKLSADGVHLKPSSPCIDQGDPSGDYSGQSDHDGEDRVAGTGVDIGADEFVDVDDDGVPDWWEKLYFASSTASVADANPDGDQANNMSEYLNDTDPLEPQTTYYVSLDGDNSWDGLAAEWDGEHGPKATIQAGIDATSSLLAGDIVVVLPGVYKGAGNRDLDYQGKIITVRSLEPTDPAVVAATIIDCEGSPEDLHRGFTFHSQENHNTKVSGFTIKGGYATSGGAIHCDSSNPTISYCAFVGNNANDGGAVYLANSANSVLQNCVIFRNTAVSKGGGVCNEISFPTIVNCTLNGNKSYAGGGISVIKGDISLNSCTITENCATYRGGGLYANSLYSNEGLVHLVNCIFWRNGDTLGHQELSQVYRDNVYVQVHNCCIQGLTTYTENGNFDTDPMLTRSGRHLRHGSPCIDRGVSGNGFDIPVDSDGESRILGGGIDVGADEFVDSDLDEIPDYWEYRYYGTPTAADCDDDQDFDGRDNLAEFEMSSNPFERANTYFVSTDGDDSWDGRSAEFDGTSGPKRTVQSGIELTRRYEGDKVVVLPGTYSGSGNRDLSFDGKAITVQNSQPNSPTIASQTVIDCDGTENDPHRGFSFTSGERGDAVLQGFTVINAFSTEGGAIRCIGSSPTISNCVLRNNRAESGSGLYASGSASSVTGCTIADNTTTWLGGAMTTHSSQITLSDCNFKNNVSDLRGGALCSEYSENIVTNCTFVSNRTEDDRGQGGAIFCQSGTNSFENCRIAKNEAVSGGGLYSGGSDFSLTNCLVSDNVATQDGGGLFSRGTVNTVITNCILWRNIDSTSIYESAQIFIDDYSSDPIVTNCCVQGLDVYSGQGNINEDPLFTADRMHLRKDSPCIDNGDETGDYADQVDIDGETRVCGSAVDIGADEFVDTDGDSLPDWWEKLYFGTIDGASPEGNPDGDGKDNLAEYEANSDPVTPPDTYYVSTSGDDSWDGLASEWGGEHGPKLTIQAGIDATGVDTDDVIVVLPGVYTGEGNRDLDYGGKGITVRSVAPESSETVAQTVIDCDGIEGEPHRGFIFHSNESADSVLSGLTIINGYADKGGGISCGDSSPTIKNCVLRANQAERGGGLYSYKSDVNLTNCLLESNDTTYYGGGMYSQVGSPFVNRCVFANNSAERDGGGYYHANFTSARFVECLIRDNSANLYGGGARSTSCDNLVMDNCRIEGNWAGQGGGGVTCGYYIDTNVFLNECVIEDNYSGGHGGGLRNSRGSLSLTGCTIRLNTAAGNNWGGGVYSSSVAGTTAKNCIFAENTAYSGGAFGIDESTVTVQNCTFKRNWVSFRGGAIRSDESSLAVHNCIVWDNPDRYGFGDTSQIATYSDVTPLEITNSCIEGLDTFAGNGNFADDPKLAAKSFHLTSDSPCLDVIDPSGDIHEQFDVDGEPRLNGDRVDVGADEFWDSDEDGIPDWWEQEHFETPTGAIPGDDPDDDERDNLTEFKLGTDPNKNPVAYYVSTNGDDSWDGLAAEWDGQHGPKQTIQAGIDLADRWEGDEIIVVPGRYTGSGNRDLNYYGKALTLKSLDPTDSVIVTKTVIDSEGNADEYHRAFEFSSMEGPRSVLRGLTIRGGYTDYGSGILCKYGKPTIECCVVRDNYAQQAGGGLAVYSGSPTANNCEFKGNEANFYGGGVYSTDSSLYFDNCLFFANYGHYAGGLYSKESVPLFRNCDFINNHSDDDGGGVSNILSDGSFVNCIFQGNRSYRRGSTVGYGGNGGGMANDESNPVVANCVFRHNYAGGLYGKGGGMSNQDSAPVVLNCVFVENVAYDSPGGLGAGSGATIANCIFWGNVTKDDAGEYAQLYGYGLTVSCSCIQDLDRYAGNGNIGLNPMLADDGIHLKAHSPCIDRGDLSVYDQEMLDIDGELRIIDSSIEIGADEFGDIDRDGLPNWWEKRYFGSPVSASPDGNPDEDERNNLSEYQLGSNPLGGPVTYYVAPDGDDSWDGLSSQWSEGHGPKRTIQAGIDVAHQCEGDTVVILPGTYTGSGNRDLDCNGKRIAVQSTDPENPMVVGQTVIDAQATEDEIHRGFWFHSAEASHTAIKGLTITKGYHERGGGIFLEHSNPLIYRCNFINNGTGAYGGAIFARNSEAKIRYSHFENNHGDYLYSYGGGVYGTGSSLEILGCVFKNNQAVDYGGAVYLALGNSSVSNCWFVGNTTYYRGGGLYVTGEGETLVSNCLFNGNWMKNSSGSGGGMFNQDGNVRAINCTFYGNSAHASRGNGGAIIAGRDGYTALSNCILWGNTDSGSQDESAQIYGSSSAISVNNSCIQGLRTFTGNGNIEENPLFVSSNGFDGVPGTEDDDLHLQISSPCRDSGDGTVIDDIAPVDLDGRPRVRGLVIDMGAYEYQETGLFGDADNNGVIDIDDYQYFQYCLDLDSAGRDPGFNACIEVFDADGDDDVDLADFAEFQRVFSSGGW